MIIPTHVQQLLDEFGIVPIPGSRYPDVGEIRAIVTIDRIWRRYGEDHIRMVMRTLVETANNKALLDEVSLWAASDLVRAYADVIENDPEAWFEVWDKTPVGELQFSLRRVRGFVPQRAALAGLIHERLYRRFELDQSQPDLLDERRQA